MMHLPANLKKYRIQKELTQEDVAQYLGITAQSVSKWERGLPISNNEKQKSTMRAALCFLYLKGGREDAANKLASQLPHTRESREVIQPLIQQGLSDMEIEENLKTIIIGDGEGIW